MNLNNNETFQNLILLCAFFGATLSFVIWYVFKKKKINVYSIKIQLRILLLLCPIVLLPIWFHPALSAKTKIIATILGVAAGIISLLSIARIGKRVRKSLRIETEEDRINKEKDK